MTEVELAKILEKAGIYGYKKLRLVDNELTSLPESIGSLSNLNILYLRKNQLASLPESISNLTNLSILDLGDNQFSYLPESIFNLANLKSLNVINSQLTDLPTSIVNFSNLTELQLDKNPLSDLSILQDLPKLVDVLFFGTWLPRQYWTKLSEWKSEWILEEENVTIKNILIQQIGYERICEELNAMELDSWREYTLLEIDDIDRVYVREIAAPIILLKMTCPSTGHIHILRVPPEMTSAEAAITWVNHGIHPDKFAVQT
ncbi:leucine-rich repeat domain-containing protein [Chamaesiphon sp. VAR_48_metabat_403]|uniref:leucine-rich repeat domain-containing protein n=1 Tax=Chamaesiphon sp. VAR_48_metabat_403 TaxID=2964700 RepID=UPI00286DBFD5|nr:leucine-rich repeat domain-containing protein [Chamaesiphon sp. VAR_48_metabat_403]